ncbi:hypothetical protein AZE42_11235 [Rhizopogon vesiculosus]|uniref:Uncharacterized protein n=1 Tax=Rhizopogon vesiculosus TaxID=180088 RepID=A0A1J8QCU7_9AGAM|nr:hypothetical protein AZE42_11235 [Rhizopogon vesiculosus]
MNDPVEGFPSDEEERKTCKWEKAKKGGHEILSSTITLLPSPMQKITASLLLHQKITLTKSSYLYVAGIKPQSTRKVLRRNVDSLVANFAFPSSLATHPYKPCWKKIP